MSGCKTELNDETRQKIIESEAKRYSMQIGNRTAKDGEFYEIFEVKTAGGDLNLKIRLAGSEEEGWDCRVDTIYRSVNNWTVGLSNLSGKTIMKTTGRPDILTPIKEEEFQTVAENLVTVSNEERWDYSSSYSESMHRKRIKEAWGIDLDRPNDKAAWKALKEPRKVLKK